MARLSATQNDYDKVSEEMGVSVRTLYRWQSKEDIELAEFLEAIVKEQLDNVPDMSGKDFGVFVGILLDKILLFKGQPNQRSENITASLDEKINRDNVNDILEEAEAIIRESASE